MSTDDIGFKTTDITGTEVLQDHSHIKGRAVKGLFSLGLRQVAVNAVSFLGQVALARLLEPRLFGIFIVVSFIVMFFKTFGDIGLGAALIQKDKVTDKDLRSTFTIQQILVLIIIAVIWISSNFICTDLYGNQLSISDVWLVRALSLSLLLASLRTVPSVKLERNLEFSKLALIEVGETITFQVIAVLLAFLKYGVWSLVYATLARGIAGIIIAYTISPWRPGISIDRASSRSLLRFGGLFQLNGIITLAKDNITAIFIAPVMGLVMAGYVNWAFTTAMYPMVFVNLISRITFPAYSRLGNSNGDLGLTIEKSIRLMSLILCPVAIVIMVLAKEITLIIYGAKWLRAYELLYYLSCATILSCVSTTLVNAMYALGRPGMVTKLIIFWTFLGWITNLILVPGRLVFSLGSWGYHLGLPPLISNFKIPYTGFNLGLEGVGLANLITAVSGVLTIFIFKKLMPVRVARNFLPLLAHAVVAGAIVFGIVHSVFPVRHFFQLITAAGLVMAIYIGQIFVFQPRMTSEFSNLVKRMFAKSELV